MNTAGPDLATPDVAIIGGGVIGCATAVYLLLESPGLDVRVIEPDPAYRLAATPRASGSGQLFRGYPQILAGDLGGAVLSPEDGWLDPWAMLDGLRRKAIDLGAGFVKDRVRSLTLGALAMSGSLRASHTPRKASASRARKLSGWRRLGHAQEELGVAAGLGEPVEQLLGGGVRLEGVQRLAQAADEVELVGGQKQLFPAGTR